MLEPVLEPVLPTASWPCNSCYTRVSPNSTTSPTCPPPHSTTMHRQGHFIQPLPLPPSSTSEPSSPVHLLLAPGLKDQAGLTIAGQPQRGTHLLRDPEAPQQQLRSEQGKRPSGTRQGHHKASQPRPGHCKCQGVQQIFLHPPHPPPLDSKDAQAGPNKAFLLEKGLGGREDHPPSQPASAPAPGPLFQEDLTWFVWGRPSLWRAGTTWLTFARSSSAPSCGQTIMTTTSMMTSSLLPQRAMAARVGQWLLLQLGVNFRYPWQSPCQLLTHRK